MLPDPLAQEFQLSMRYPRPSARIKRDADSKEYRTHYFLEVELPKEDWDVFAEAELTGMVIEAVCQVTHRSTPGARTEPPVHPYGQQARELRLSGFFTVLDVLKAIGTDDEFREWIQRRPSAYSGDYSEWINGEGRCVAAHVRRAGESGTAYKAGYACIPLTDAEHQRQHAEGETTLQPQEWWERQRNNYATAWAWEKVRMVLNVNSMGDLPPEELYRWAADKGIEKYLPAAYQPVNGDGS